MPTASPQIPEAAAAAAPTASRPVRPGGSGATSRAACAPDHSFAWRRCAPSRAPPPHYAAHHRRRRIDHYAHFRVGIACQQTRDLGRAVAAQGSLVECADAVQALETAAAPLAMRRVAGCQPGALRPAGLRGAGYRARSRRRLCAFDLIVVGLHRLDRAGSGVAAGNAAGSCTASRGTQTPVSAAQRLRRLAGGQALIDQRRVIQLQRPRHCRARP